MITMAAYHALALLKDLLNTSDRYTKLHTLEGHSGGVYCIAPSPDGTVVATGGMTPSKQNYRLLITT
jgi:WD40 repeat protein